MHLLILGGTPDHPGGVEAFCDRSTEALNQRGTWQITQMPTNTAFLTMRRLPLLFVGLIRLAQYRSKGPACVWLQYVNLPDLTYLALAKVLGLRVMVTPHLGSRWRSQSIPLLKSLSGWLLKFADRLALISKTQELEILLPSSVPRSLIRNFLPSGLLMAEIPASNTPSEPMQLLHSGRLSEGKGTYLFIEVCAQLRAAGLPFFARITGGADDATFARLNAMIARFDLGDQVAVLGRVSDAQLLEIFRASDVLIHLSRIDSYPLIVLEAMACSIFPVCMELAGARDMIETYDGQIVSEKCSVDETATYLLALNLTEARYRASVSAARVRADYAWDRCSSALENALHACAPGPARIVPR